MHTRIPLRSRATALVAALLLLGPAAASAVAGTGAGSSDGAGSVEIIVMFDDEVTEDDLDVLRTYGFTKGHLYSNIPGVFTKGPVDALDDLRKHPEVVDVTRNQELVYHLESSRKAIGVQGSVVGAGAQEEYGATGDNTTVAVVDTGVDGTHPDVSYPEDVVYNHKIVAPTFESLTGFSESGLDTVQMANTDDQGHGTHVSSTACGDGDASDGEYAGVAPECEIVGLGMGVSLSMALGAFGLDWVLEHHEEYDIEVVSNSWGPRGGTDYDPDGPIFTLNRKLHEAGVTVVWASGNSGPEEGTLGYGQGPHAIGVANFDDRTGDLASSSSRGIPGDPHAHPDVAAPGTDVVAARSHSAGRPALGDYAGLSGTSMSAPHVAGVVALLESRTPGDLSPDEVHRIIETTADPDQVRVPTADGDRAAAFHEVGHGAVDAREALALALGHRSGVDAAIQPDRVTTEPVITDDTLEVTGSALEPPEPARAGDWPVSGDLFVYHDAVAFGVDPSGTDRPTLVPGEDVQLSYLDVASGHPDYPVDAATPATFVVTPEDDPSNEVARIPASLPHDGSGDFVDVDAQWRVPTNLSQGTYSVALEVATGPTGVVTGPVSAVEVVDPGVAHPGTPDTSALPDPPDGPSADGSPGSDVDNPFLEGDHDFDSVSDPTTVFFEDDFETRRDGYDVANRGSFGGEATTWTYVGDGAPLFRPANSGDHMWYVGATRDGAVSGSGYTDRADADLRTPAIDLTKATNATASYHLTGGSEEGWDFLHVEARTPGSPSWTTLESVTGFETNWTEHSVDLAAFAGDEVQLRFRFDSDFVINEGPGWQVDDLRVTGPTVDNAAPVAHVDVDDAFHEATRTLGVAGADGDGTVESWSLDLGDGTTVDGTDLPATVNHTYDVEKDVTATLTVTDDGGATATDSVTFSTVRSVQADPGDGWRTVADDDGDVGSWNATLDVSGLADGQRTLEVRAPDGVGGYHTVERPYFLARDPVVTTPDVDPVLKGRDVTLDVDVAGASGSFDVTWDLDDDGAFDDANGTSAVASFDQAGLQEVTVQAVDAEDASSSTNASFEVPVAEVAQEIVSTGTFVVGTPDETVRQGFGLFDYQPGPETDTVPFNVTSVEETYGGEVIRAELLLTWGSDGHDLDVYVEDPDGDIRQEGTSATFEEHVVQTIDEDGVWKAHVEPWLVTEPTDYELTVRAVALPGT